MIPTTGHSTLVVHSLHLGGDAIHLPIRPANLAICGSRLVVLCKKRLAKLASFGAFWTHQLLEIFQLLEQLTHVLKENVLLACFQSFLIG